MYPCAAPIHQILHPAGAPVTSGGHARESREFVAFIRSLRPFEETRILIVYTHVIASASYILSSWWTSICHRVASVEAKCTLADPEEGRHSEDHTQKKQQTHRATQVQGPREEVTPLLLHVWSICATHESYNGAPWAIHLACLRLHWVFRRKK
jgi:hypothetical protein